MGRNRRLEILVASLLLASAASGLTPAEKCESAKLKEAGKYGFCRLKAEAKAAKTAGTPDYSKCDATYAAKWSAIESAGGGMCPSTGDQSAIGAYIAQHTGALAAALAGGSLPGGGGGVLKTGQTTSYGTGSDGDLQKGVGQVFVDNGDGTITDTTTGLMWEKKSADGTIHDKDNTYKWGIGTSPYPMNGSMVTVFLAGLNGGGGFAGHTDWRIPNINELESIRNLEIENPATYAVFNSGCAMGCTVTTCSCTKSDAYFSSTTLQEFPDPAYAWFVDFTDGHVELTAKSSFNAVRAVRGGS